MVTPTIPFRKKAAIDAYPELKSDFLFLLESETDKDVEFSVDGE